LKASPVLSQGQVDSVTDGDASEAEDLTSGDTDACAYRGFADHFELFRPLAGITTAAQVRESSFDIRAASYFATTL
jgi:hypothetical protein